jgi:EAL domain-containing protein (putative c-di-GMP-specific phosphodiesterase class I)
MYKADDIRDRFIGFAFAAADLLAEISAAHRLTFAAGAFRERFGRDAESFTGLPVSTLVADEDRAHLDLALDQLTRIGRLAPVGMRLGNAERTPMSLSGLILPNRMGTAYLTFARPPATSPLLPSGPAAAPAMREAISQRLRAEDPCHLNLVEVSGLAGLADDQRQIVEAQIAAALRVAAGQGAVAAEIGTGRFGVVGGTEADSAALTKGVGAVLRAAGLSRTPLSTPVLLAGEGVSAAEVARAVRFALTSFASGGVAAIEKVGFHEGVLGFLKKAEARASAVRAAIERGKFRLVYQPVVSLPDRSVHHFEALLRPYPIEAHPISNTQEFVQFAEAVGLSDLLDRAVLARSLEALQAGQSRVAINVSGLSLQNAEFCEALLAALASSDRVANRLMVELTETASIEDLAEVAKTIRRLGDSGIAVCLDDFGAGYSDFRYLKELTVDFVKLDGSYVHGAQRGPRESGFISAIVDLARCAGARTIAEAVETEAQAEMVHGLGVDFGQGWLFGKPGNLPS